MYFWFCACAAHAHVYKITVVVDTDMALDDIRAIAMLLNSDMVNIPLIATSDGVVSPQKGARNLRRLLAYFPGEKVRIAEGRVLGKSGPPWRPWSENISWPETPESRTEVSVVPNAPEEIAETLSRQEGGALYLCMGPLTNLSDSLKLSPGVKDKISRLIYYGAHPDDALPGWNTGRDPDAARRVFESGLRIDAMRLTRTNCGKNQFRLEVDFESAGRELITYNKAYGPAGRWCDGCVADIHVNDGKLNVLFSLSAKNGKLDYTTQSRFRADIKASNKVADKLMNAFLGNWNRSIRKKVEKAVDGALRKGESKKSILDGLNVLFGTSGKTITNAEFKNGGVLFTYY